jgi:2-methylisocitrate lyase-like PEP mutase family enzyme
VRFFFGTRPEWWELEAYAAECRAFRAVAIDAGLDPDTAMPEDILLMARDDAGKLAVHKEFESALERAVAYRTMRADNA